MVIDMLVFCDNSPTVNNPNSNNNNDNNTKIPGDVKYRKSFLKTFSSTLDATRTTSAPTAISPLSLENKQFLKSLGLSLRNDE